MKYAQDLYEEWIITYMRTDSTKISKDFATIIVNYIKNTYGENFVSSSPFSKCENKKKETVKLLMNVFVLQILILKILK